MNFPTITRLSCHWPLVVARTALSAHSAFAGEGALNIVAWPGYLECGETDKNYDWVTQFEKDTGCKVNVKMAATSYEMVSLMS